MKGRNCIFDRIRPCLSRYSFRDWRSHRYWISRVEFWNNKRSDRSDYKTCKPANNSNVCPTNPWMGKKEDWGFREFWAMIKRKEINKIIGAELLVGIILAVLVLLWAMLAWVINTEIGGGQGSSIVILCITIIGITTVGLLAIRFSFVNQAIADKNLGVIEGFKYSWKITENHFWDLIRFHIYFLLWNILGLLCLIVGVIWTSTMRQIAFSKLYLELSEQADKAE